MRQFVMRKPTPPWREINRIESALRQSDGHRAEQHARSIESAVCRATTEAAQLVDECQFSRILRLRLLADPFREGCAAPPRLPLGSVRTSRAEASAQEAVGIQSRRREGVRPLEAQPSGSLRRDARSPRPSRPFTPRRVAEHPIAGWSSTACSPRAECSMKLPKGDSLGVV
jgi:hypothetical protein